MECREEGFRMYGRFVKHVHSFTCPASLYSECHQPFKVMWMKD